MKISERYKIFGFSLGAFVFAAFIVTSAQIVFGPSGSNTFTGSVTAASTIADGADVTQGAIADASVTTGTGTVNAHLRGANVTLGTLLTESVFAGRIGEVQASPTSNTVLDRLKQLLTGITLAAGNNNIGDVDVASIAAGANTIGNVNSIQSGTWTVQPGNTPNTTPWLVTPSAQKQFFGTLQTVISSAVDIAANACGGAPSASYDNTSDSTYPAARTAIAVVSIPDWAAAPVQGTTVDLYGIINNVDGTADETDAPTGSPCVLGGGHYFGSFIIAGADALQRRAIPIDVTGFTSIDFYLWNRTAQNMNNDGGTSVILKIQPLTSN